MRAILITLTLVLPLSSVACVDAGIVPCGEQGEVICPDGTHCGPANECVPDACGNNEVDALEECDGEGSVDTTTLRCVDYGFYKGPALTCSATCTVDTSQCSETCGDHIINGPERCDGIPPTGFGCADFGFDVGTIGCSDSCTPAFDFCSSIGWQLIPGGGSDELYALYLSGPDSGVAVGRGGEVIAAKDGVWLPITQSVSTDDLNAVYGGVHGIIAVGNNGTILHYDSAAGAVTRMASPTTAHLRGIAGNPMGAIAVGDGGTILRFDGTTWTTMSSPVSVDLFAVHVNAGRVVAVGANATVLELRTTGWTQLPVTGLPAVNLYAVQVFQNDIIVAGALTTLARIGNNNAAIVADWDPIEIASNVELRALAAAGPSDVYAAGGGGLVVHWDDGLFVRRQDTNTTRTIFGLASAGGRIVGVTRGGAVIGFNGTSRHLYLPRDVEVYSVYTDATQTVAAGRMLLRASTTDGAWEEQLFPANLQVSANAVRSVFPIGNDVFLGSRTLGLFMSDDFGPPTQVSATPVHGLWATTSPLRVVTVGAQVIESTGTTTATLTFPQTSTTTAHGANILRGVWASTDGFWFAVGDNGVVLRRTPTEPWTAMTTGTTRNLLAVWGSAANDVFAVGEVGTIIHWDGTRWRRHHSGIAENLSSISGNTRSDIFVTGTSFTRLHYDGLSWSRMAAYNQESPSVATYGGVTYYTSGKILERHDRVITSTETRCEDPFDNDSDGVNNCDDPDCRNAFQCLRGGACETLERVTCETHALATSTFTGVSRITDLPCLDDSTPGPEASFRYVADRSGTVTVTIDDPTHQLVLVATEADLGHCLLQTCQAATSSGDTQSVTFTATAGAMYYLVVDGPVGVAAPFTLSVDCT